MHALGQIANYKASYCSSKYYDPGSRKWSLTWAGRTVTERLGTKYLTFPPPPTSKVKIIGEITWKMQSKCANSLWIRYLKSKCCKTASPVVMSELDKKDISWRRLFLSLRLSSNPSTWCSDPMNFPQQAVGMTNILFKAIPSSGPLVQTAKTNPLIPSTQCWPKEQRIKTQPLEWP